MAQSIAPGLMTLVPITDGLAGLSNYEIIQPTADAAQSEAAVDAPRHAEAVRLLARHRLARWRHHVLDPGVVHAAVHHLAVRHRVLARLRAVHRGLGLARDRVHEALADACVVGSQDAYRGETVRAVVVRRASTDAWIDSIGMSTIPDCTPPLEGRSCSQWTAADYELEFERELTAAANDASSNAVSGALELRVHVFRERGGHPQLREGQNQP